MSNRDDYESYDALDLARLVRKGDPSATEILEAAQPWKDRRPSMNL